MFNITLKYFNFFSNTAPVSGIAHITRDFFTCYSCSYYISMIYTGKFKTIMTFKTNLIRTAKYA